MYKVCLYVYICTNTHSVIKDFFFIIYQSGFGPQRTFGIVWQCLWLSQPKNASAILWIESRHAAKPAAVIHRMTSHNRIIVNRAVINWMFGSRNSYIEALLPLPSSDVLEGGAFGRYLGLNEVMRGELS